MIDIEKLEAIFGFKKPNIALRSLCSTISAKMKNANYCCEYLSRYDQKLKVRDALRAAKELDLIGQGFEYNIFNRSMLRCVFYSLVGNNVSRIDNLEDVIFVLFREKLEKYVSDRKSFSFQKLCEDFPGKNITSVLQAILDDHQGFTRIQRLRNQMAHSTIDDILSNNPMLDEEDDCFINPNFTLSGKKEDVIDFAKSLNELLSKIEEQIFNCLMTHGKDCLNDVQNQ